METAAGLKHMESTLSLACDRTSALKAKLEDLLFRAQRISAAQKSNAASTDTMFGYDLQHFRREVRTFAAEIQGLPVAMGLIERAASYDDAAAKLAGTVMRQSMRLSQSLRGLHDTALLAHQHIRVADHKIEAWYLAQEIEELVSRGQGLPGVANKILVATGTPPKA